MAEAPSLYELQKIMDWVEAYAGLELDESAEEDGIKEAIQLMDKWLAEMAQLELSNEKTCKLALETAEKRRPIEGILALSTAHIKESTNDLLDAGTKAVTYHRLGQHAWMVYINSEGTLHPDDVPDELEKLMAHARDCGCTWLMLDSDATVLPEFEAFDW